MKGVRALVLPSALLEAEHVLRTQYQISLGDRQNSLYAIVESSYLDVVDRTEMLDAILLTGRSSISFTDAYHAAMARRHCAGNLVSFDRKLSGVDGLTRIEPGLTTESPSG
jgi:predicted nucleic acid-binding protein